MPLSSKQRAELRAEAHHLQATVHVGQQGPTGNVLKALDDALRTHELVKVAFTKAAPDSGREAAHSLAGNVGAEVVQVIGRTASLYRHNPDIARKEGAPPPWRK